MSWRKLLRDGYCSFSACFDCSGGTIVAGDGNSHCAGRDIPKRGSEIRKRIKICSKYRKKNSLHFGKHSDDSRTHQSENRISLLVCCEPTIPLPTIETSSSNPRNSMVSNRKTGKANHSVPLPHRRPSDRPLWSPNHRFSCSPCWRIYPKSYQRNFAKLDWIWSISARCNISGNDSDRPIGSNCLDFDCDWVCLGFGSLDPIKVARTDVSILIVALSFIDYSLIDAIVPGDVTSLLCWCLHLQLRRWLLEKVAGPSIVIILLLDIWPIEIVLGEQLAVDWLFHNNHRCSFAAIPGISRNFQIFDKFFFFFFFFFFIVLFCYQKNSRFLCDNILVSKIGCGFQKLQKNLKN